MNYIYFKNDKDELCKKEWTPVLRYQYSSYNYTAYPIVEGYTLRGNNKTGTIYEVKDLSELQKEIDLLARKRYRANIAEAKLQEEENGEYTEAVKAFTEGLAGYIITDNDIEGLKESKLVFLKPVKELPKKYRSAVRQQIYKMDASGYMKLSKALTKIMEEQVNKAVEKPDYAKKHDIFNAVKNAEHKYRMFIKRAIETYEPDEFFDNENDCMC